MFAILKGLLGLGLFALAASSTPRAMALPNATNEDDEPIYGWSVIGNSLNATTWEFDENNKLVYSYAAEGDTANQRMYNYALRNLPIDEGDTYTVSADFTPDPDMDLNGERTYGIVCFYQDADNYLIYWLQQKPSEWSGQFYGRLNGLFRSMTNEWSGGIPGTADCNSSNWWGGEYADFWWDQSICNHPDLVGRRDALVNTPVTLGVTSSWYGDLTKNGVTKQARKFSLWQEVDGTRFNGPNLYVAFGYDNPRTPVHVEGPFYTGIYSEAFSFGVDFHLSVTNTDFAGNVVDEFEALPATVSSVDDILAIEDARVSYENLLEFKSGVSAEGLALLTDAEGRAAAYIDDVIRALDPSSPTFAADVDAAVELFTGRNSWIQDLVVEYNLLVEMVRQKNNPDPVSSEEPPVSSEEPPVSSEEPVSPATSEVPPVTSEIPPVTTSEVIPETSEDQPTPDKKGCGGSIIATSAIISVLALGGITLLSFKKKQK